DFSFEALVPRPSDEVLGRKRTILPGNLGYAFGSGLNGVNPMQWEVDNWGTKWDAGEPVVDEKNERVTFQTAWSAPLPWLEKVSAMEVAKNIRFVLHWMDE